MNFLDYIEINPTILLTKGKHYPFVEMANVGTNSREPIQIDYREFTSGTKFQDGDSVIARIEPCLQNGKKFFCHNIGTGFGSTEYLIFRPKNDKIDNVYLYYLLQTDYIRKKMIGSMTGATGRQRVNNDVFKTIEIEPPEINTQKKVGTILSAYDDLIENNQKQIKLLEEAAQRLYKEWFVDLRFPGYETTPVVDGVPEGWEQHNLGDMASILRRGISPKYDDNGKYLVISQKCIRQSIMDIGEARRESKEYAPELNLQDKDTVICSTGTGTLGRVGQVFGAYPDTTFDSHVTLVRTERYQNFFYQAIKHQQDFLMGMGRGSTNQQELYRGVIENLQILAPTWEILNKAESLFSTTHDKITALNAQIGLLVDARDRLLPKLMSGELEVLHGEL